MRRDMELIRLLLLELEGVEKPDLSRYSEEKQLYHSYLLIDSGLVRGSFQDGGEGQLVAARMLDLTWKGHEFLDAARNPKTWKKVWDKVKDSGIMFDVLLALLKKAVLEGVSPGP